MGCFFGWAGWLSLGGEGRARKGGGSERGERACDQFAIPLCGPGGGRWALERCRSIHVHIHAQGGGEREGEGEGEGDGGSGEEEGSVLGKETRRIVRGGKHASKQDPFLGGERCVC
jgi:hypothetical protein